MTSTPSRTSSSPPRLTSTGSSTLADVLERVLDKGIVIAGDISVSVGSTELLSIRIRLLIASVDKAKEMGINWWESDPFLSSQTRQLQDTNQKLLQRVEALETELRSLKASQRDPQLQPAPED
ncbi:gas vesicle protein [Kamptonema cortianum]|nr:gas vesicle protein [Kamptonema cortianum]